MTKAVIGGVLLALVCFTTVRGQSYTPDLETLAVVVHHLITRITAVEQRRPSGSIGPAKGPWNTVRRPIAHQWGRPGDIPLTGDFDGDALGDMAVYRPSTGTWHVLFSSRSWYWARAGVYQWGLPDDVPMPSDRDGDGVTDLVVYRPSTGVWYVEYSNGHAWP